MDRFLYLIFRVFVFLILRLPSRLRWGLSRWLGGFASLFLKNRVQLTQENLERAGYSPEEALSITKKCWASLGLVGAEFIYYMMGYPERLKKDVQWEGEEHLIRALARNKGVIIASAHLGNWELLGTCLTEKYPVVAIAREQENKDFDRYINDVRKKFARMVPMKASLKPLISALHHNEIAYFILDQRGKGVNCEFMGRQAQFFVGAATFAIRTGAALIPARIVRVEPEKFRLVIDPEVELVDTGHLEEDAQATTVRLMKVLEGQIRENPEQWLWMHKLWPSDIKV
ncbi:MAG TPA: lysophospholipid acyltransferase family protein [Bacillota bacterium]|nr:lysophospholipid acyltransferase family protein [Bacillota bacterium]